MNEESYRIPSIDAAFSKKPEPLALDEVARHLGAGSACIWTIPEIRSIVAQRFEAPLVSYPDTPPSGIRTLLVIGGGVLIDVAKLWRRSQDEPPYLIAIPSLWGSGAEDSPVTVTNVEGEKRIEMSEHLLPDARAIWPELVASLPPEALRAGAGDVWSHALEGFFSPLATEPLREELAVLIRLMLATPIHPETAASWFEFSAQACAGQARSSVGLVHGIAHTLEGVLKREEPELEAGHARLCSAFLWPVMLFDRAHAPSFDSLLSRFGLDAETVIEHTRTLFFPELYQAALPRLAAHWREILRNPLTRSNSALVRPAHLQFFTEPGFT